MSIKPPPLARLKSKRRSCWRKPTPKKETTTEKVKRKVKRAWRNLTGTKFDVACPALIPLTHSTCTETGSRKEARAKCQSANPLCSVSEVK